MSTTTVNQTTIRHLGFIAYTAIVGSKPHIVVSDTQIRLSITRKPNLYLDIHYTPATDLYSLVLHRYNPDTATSSAIDTRTDVYVEQLADTALDMTGKN